MHFEIIQLLSSEKEAFSSLICANSFEIQQKLTQMDSIINIDVGHYFLNVSRSISRSIHHFSIHNVSTLL